MTPHLTSQQISEAVLELHPGDSALHLEQCAACRDSVSGLQRDLALFGNGVRNWSESQERDPSELAVRKPHSRFGFPQFATAGLLAAVLLVALVLTARSHLQPAPELDIAAADGALLQRVDAELAETIPGPMQPLTKLVAVDRVEKNNASATDAVKTPE